MEIRYDRLYMNIHSKTLCHVVWCVPPMIEYKNIGVWNQKTNVHTIDEFQAHWVMSPETPPTTIKCPCICGMRDLPPTTPQNP